MTNLELQSDEVLALQSIFDRNFHFLNSDQYEILISFDLPSTFVIQSKNDRIPIRHLPPLSLTIEYHDDYPSISPPRFRILCFYLSQSDLLTIENRLKNFTFIKGEVCVYEWIELIKSEIGNELILDTEDERSKIGLVQRLIDFDHERDDEEFAFQTQTCSICFDEIHGALCLRLRQCGHFYCRTCLNNHVQMSFQRGLFGERINCPQTQCQKALLPHEIKNIIQNDEIYQRYERVTLQHGLEMMDDILWCPRCQQAVLTGQDDDNLAMCDACQYTFCKKCKEIFHSNTMCPKEYQLERLRLKREKELENIRKNIEAAAEAQRQKDAAAAKFLEKRKPVSRSTYQSLLLTLEDEERVIQEILNSERVELLNTQPCPKCHVQIEKNGGCSHMFCSRCNTHFTWQSLPDRQPVPGRYLTTSKTDVPEIETIKEQIEKVASKIVLQTDEQEKPEEVQHLVDNKSAMGALLLSRARKCPRKQCNYVHVKSTHDNWIHCNECTANFCFVCGKLNIREKHFEKKCPRHSSFE